MTSFEYGGIWCTVYLREFYNESKVTSSRHRLRTWFGPAAEGIVSRLTIPQLKAYVQEGIERTVREAMSGKQPDASKSRRRLEEKGKKEYNDIVDYENRVEHFDKRIEQEGPSDSLKKKRQNAIDNQKAAEAAYYKSQRAADKASAIIGEIMKSFGFAIVKDGKLLESSVNMAPASRQGSLSHMSHFMRNNFSKMPVHGKGWYVIITVAHSLAARQESRTAYPDGKYKGFNIKILYDFAHTAAQSILAATGRTSKEIRYGYILSRRGYEGKPLLLE